LKGDEETHFCYNSVKKVVGYFPYQGAKRQEKRPNDQLDMIKEEDYRPGAFMKMGREWTKEDGEEKNGVKDG